MWQVEKGDKGLSTVCLQTVTLASGQPTVEEAFFNHALYNNNSSMVVLANTKRSAVYVLKVEKAGSADFPTHDLELNSSAPRFSSISEFTVTMPIISVTACEEHAASESSEDALVQLFC
eukprot:4837304-Pyramimonas_sp.AAC.1